jgi:hypothetical protein
VDKTMPPSQINFKIAAEIRTMQLWQVPSVAAKPPAPFATMWQAVQS